ncbi:MAG: hypothetical protein ABSB59_20205 [Streptosporangiaceae bacterium]
MSTIAVSSSIPSTVVPGGAPAVARVTRSGAQETIRSKCGRTRRCGSTPRPGSGSLGGSRTAGTQSVSAIAPAEHPASAAPARQAASMAAQTRVPRSVRARNRGFPPDR